MRNRSNRCDDLSYNVCFQLHFYSDMYPDIGNRYLDIDLYKYLYISSLIFLCGRGVENTEAYILKIFSI